MSTQNILITGAGGEIGHGLVEALTAGADPARIVALDLHEPQATIKKHCAEVIVGDITDSLIIARLEEQSFTAVYHLAALLSTSAEKIPHKAHDVNVNGTLGLLEMARRIGRREGRPVQFLFPSSIAAYGIPTLAEKNAAGKVREDEWNNPETMYGANKLYCEHLGRYYSEFYQRLGDEREAGYVDFRALRFPGLMSAFTLPTGGTSDYASEMLHSAKNGKPYQCFVREDTRIPFMAMPDAITALLQLAAAPRANLSRTAYNIAAFAPSAGEIRAKVLQAFPAAEIGYAPHAKRQGIVDSWPPDLDDSAARKDWGWQAEYGFDAAFDNYLIPNLNSGH